MSSYQSMRFKGIVKEEYRADFEGIALRGEWGKSNIPELREYADEFRPVPRFACDMPEKWDGCDMPGKEFETRWNPDTGEWVFACTYNLRSYGFGMMYFDDFIEKYIERVDVEEYWGED